jgi:hypothetical protein
MRYFGPHYFEAKCCPSANISCLGTLAVKVDCCLNNDTVSNPIRPNKPGYHERHCSLRRQKLANVCANVSRHAPPHQRVRILRSEAVYRSVPLPRSAASGPGARLSAAAAARRPSFATNKCLRAVCMHVQYVCIQCEERLHARLACDKESSLQLQLRTYHTCESIRAIDTCFASRRLFQRGTRAK